MNAPVLDQPRHRFARDFAAHRVKARNHHRARGVIDEDGDAGGGFKRADIAALAVNNAAFDFIVASENAQFWVPEVELGVPFAGSPADVPRTKEVYIAQARPALGLERYAPGDRPREAPRAAAACPRRLERRARRGPGTGARSPPRRRRRLARGGRRGAQPGGPRRA